MHDPFRGAIRKFVSIPGALVQKYVTIAKLRSTPVHARAEGPQVECRCKNNSRCAGWGRYKSPRLDAASDGGLRRHKRMLLSCFETKGRGGVVFLYSRWREASHMSRRTTDCRLALQSVTSQQLEQLEQLGAAGLGHDTWCPATAACRVPARAVALASRLEEKHRRTTTAAEEPRHRSLSRPQSCIALRRMGISRCDITVAVTREQACFACSIWRDH